MNFVVVIHTYYIPIFSTEVTKSSYYSKSSLVLAQFMCMSLSHWNTGLLGTCLSLSVEYIQAN